MKLNPKGPPGRATRKALQYASEVRRLHAEGHTLDSIRLAQLDAGVSVSVSTVRRELARPASTWELTHAHEAAFAFEDPQQDNCAMPVTAPTPCPLDASSGQPHELANCAPAVTQLGYLDSRRSTGLLSKVFGVLRRLRRARG